MSTDSTGASDTHVEDEGDVVDRQIKSHVLGLRKQIDEDERNIYVEMASDPTYDLSVDRANEFWGVSVRQYLRAIKRLWTTEDSSNVRNVDHYWRELLIGREDITPPDTHTHQFSLVQYTEEYSEQELRRAIGLPRDAEVPKPKRVEFFGLNSILNHTKVAETWTVQTDTTGPPPEHSSVTLQTEMAIPKHILENAVEAADAFLQQAGLGFKTAVPAYWGEGGPGL